MGDRYRREIAQGAMPSPYAVHAFMFVRFQKLLGSAYRSAVLLAGLLAFFQGNAGADSIGGYIDLTYFRSDDKTELGPLSSDMKTRGFRQQYSLSLTKTIYPNLQFSASGLFDQFENKVTTDGVDTNSTVRLTRPYLDLKWGSYPFTADFTYYKTQTENSISGGEKFKFISDNYQGRLGWRPADLPTLDIYLLHANNYDAARVSRDIVTDQVSWTAQYTAFRNLSLRWQGNYTDNEDKLKNVEVKSLNNDLRADYSKDFFNNRVNLFASYEIANNKIDATARGNGGTSVPFFIQPVQGLSSLTANPNPVIDILQPVGSVGALGDSLTDGEFNSSAGIQIGLPPAGGEKIFREIGLQFFVPTVVDTLQVWIDRDQLPDPIANCYLWKVFISDNNQTWTEAPGTQNAAAPFIQPGSDHFFKISFPSTPPTIYIKVVVNPLTQLCVAQAPIFPDPGNINVTEMQAFNTQLATTGGSKRSLTSTTQRVNTAVHVLLLERPQLYYDLSYSLTTTSTNISSSPTIWTLSNTLGASEQLSSVFTARANVSRQDNKDIKGKTVNYNWSVSLDAVPISTFTQNLTYGGNIQQLQEGTTTGHSLYLTSVAQLYTDISAFLNLGAFVTSQFTGRDSKGTTVAAGITLSPSRKLSLTLSYGLNKSRESGGDQPDSSSSNSSTDIAVSYNPFPALFFYGDWAWQEGNLLQNYNVSWSPFQGGQLTLNFFYNEILSQLDNSKSRIIRPYLRLDLKRAGYLSLSYSIIHDESKGVFTATSLNHKQKVAAIEYRVNF